MDKSDSPGDKSTEQLTSSSSTPNYPANSSSSNTVSAAQFGNQASPSDNPIRAKKTKLILVSLSILILCAAIIGLGYFDLHKNMSVSVQNQQSAGTKSTSSNLSGKSNISQSNTHANDNKIDQELAAIGNAIENDYVGPNGSYNSPFLPSNLNQLGLKGLNYGLSSYNYKVLQHSGGEKNRTEIYQICAGFVSNTFSVSAYNNIFNGNGVDGTVANSYSVHTDGNQCFTNDLSAMGVGLSVNLNSDESQYKNQLDTN